MELVVELIAEWMRCNRQRLNPEQTNFLRCATRRRCILLDTAEPSVCGALIWPSISVRDLGVLLKSDLSIRTLILKTSHQELHQVVASWSCEGGCRRFCHFRGGPLQQPERTECTKNEDALWRSCFLCRRSSMLEQSPSCYSFA